MTHFSTTLIILSAFLAGCAGIPKPDPIPRCALIANAGGSPAYLKCQNFDGTKVSGPVTRIPIADLLQPTHPEKYICTTDEGYAYLQGVYVPKLKRYIEEHAK